MLCNPPQQAVQALQCIKLTYGTTLTPACMTLPRPPGTFSAMQPKLYVQHAIRIRILQVTYATNQTQARKAQPECWYFECNTAQLDVPHTSHTTYALCQSLTYNTTQSDM